jgi:hypothetical protein
MSYTLTCFAMATAPLVFGNAFDYRIYQNPAKPIKYRIVCATEGPTPDA